MTMLLNYIQGKGKLWKAFWLFTVLPVVLIPLLSMVTALFLFKMPFGSSLEIYLFILMIIWGISIIFGLLATWQCAHNCKNRFWMWVSRVMILSIFIYNLYIGWDAN